jgi:hypothetical protein
MFSYLLYLNGWCFHWSLQEVTRSTGLQLSRLSGKVMFPHLFRSRKASRRGRRSGLVMMSSTFEHDSDRYEDKSINVPVSFSQSFEGRLKVDHRADALGLSSDSSLLLE